MNSDPTTNSERPHSSGQDESPRLWRWALSVAGAVGITGIICCVAPMVLFMMGMVGGIWAISFADFFYHPDGSAALGAWLLRGLAGLVAAGGIAMYRRRQNQCAIDPVHKQRNLILVSLVILTLGTGLYFTLEEVSSWYFDQYIVPAQQEEYRMRMNN